MPSFETLDRIADAHNPLLGLAWVALVAAAAFSRQGRVALGRALFGLGTLVVAYGLEYVDIATGLWPRFGLDYSTHTAVAVAMVATLWACWRPAGIAALATFALYVPLMVYQGYHPPGDIASTALAVALLTAPLAWRAGSQRGQGITGRASLDPSRA